MNPHKLLLKPLFALLLILLPATASKAQTAPWLFKRYPQGAAYNRITEDVLTLTIAIPADNRARIAIRLCSKQPLLFALGTARTDPFRVAELLVGAYSYLPERVMFVRSEDCLGKDAAIPAVEIWGLAEDGLLPRHVEARLSSQVRSSTLGKKHVSRGVRDYVAATQELIKNLQANPTSRGVVVGYYFYRPSAAVKRSLRTVKTLFQRSGLPPDRYLVRSVPWNDEFSMNEPEPPYPRVFLLEEGEFIDGASAR